MSVKTFFAAMTLKVKVIIICSAVAVTSAAAVAVGVAVTKEDAYRVLKVFEMTGTAMVDREGSGELEAYVGMNLESGDTLTVGDDSSLRISMDSDKYVLLDSGTILELTAAGTAADSRTSIALKKGTILNEITNPLSANSSYEVSTPKATMAVRGTSFTVSVEEDSVGGFTIREDTFNGMVEVILLDTKGNPRNDKALVPADKGVTIRTEPDKESGNPAEIDGNSRFVYEDENGVISELGEGDDPIRDIRYNMISATVRENALRSNDENLMLLDEKIVAKLRGSSDNASETQVQTTAPVSEPVTTPAVTSVPETSEITDEFTQTAAAFNDPLTLNENIQTETFAVSEVSNETPTETEAVSTEVTSDTQTAETTVEETVSEESESSETSVETTTDETTAERSVTTVTTLPETKPVSSTMPYAGQTGGASSEPQYPSAAEGIIKTFNVNFMCEGKLIYSVSVKSGETVADIPELSEKTGYTAKWICGGAEFTSETKVTSDMTVTAEYTIISYTVTLTSDADTSYSKTITADYGALLVDVLPDVPEVTGYTGVWKIGGTVVVSGGITVTSDLDIKAVYTINTYTVTFKAEGSADITRTADHGSTVSDIPELPEKTGYTAKWMSGGKEFTSETKVTSDMTVTAEYTIISYTVSLTSSKDPSYLKNVSADYGTLLKDALPAVPKVTGYTGVWKIDGTADVTNSYKVTDDVAVKAVYTINTYTVTFTADADTPYSHEEAADYGTLLSDILPEMPEKTGHDGVWTVGGTPIDADYIIEDDTNVVADYTPKTYTVKFLNADGSLYDTREVEYNTTVTDIPNIQKDGYIIKWIYNGSEFTSDVKITENIEVTAEETEAVKLTFNYVTKDPEVIIIPKGTSLQDNGYELPEPDAQKYFTGRWSAYITVDWPFDVDTSFDVIESAITYSFVFYDTDGSTEKDTRLLAYYEFILDWTSYSGIDADSWLVYSEDSPSSRTLTSSDTVKTLVDEFGFDETSTIKIVAVMNERTLTWYDESGTKHTSPVNKGEKVLDKLNELYTLPTGHYWADTNKSTPIRDYVTISATNTVVYAVPETYAVAFKAEGSAYTIIKNAKYNTTVTDIPDVPTADGFIYKWMYTNSEGNTVEFTSEVKITENIEVTTEKFDAVTITFQFMWSGADPITYTIPKGTSLAANGYSVPENDTKKYYQSSGWVTDDLNHNPINNSSIINESVSVYSEQTRKSYTVSYYDTDGTLLYQVGGYSTNDASYGSATPSKGTFSHWEFEKEDGTRITIDPVNIDVAYLVDTLDIEGYDINVYAVYSD